MKIAAPVVALLISAPCIADAWMSPLSLMPRPMLVMTPRSRFFRDTTDALANRGFTQTSPRYEITDNDENFKIAIDVPGMKIEDIHISVEDDGHMLAIDGKRESSGDDYRFETKFSQRFSLDPSVELDKFTANLNDGVLVVSAPKDMKKIEEAVRSIPISTTASAEGSTEEQPPAVKEEEVDLPAGEPVKVEHHKEEEKLAA